MSDNRVRKDYPEIQDNPNDTEGDEGNPGVPGEYLDEIVKKGNDEDEDLLMRGVFK